MTIVVNNWRLDPSRNALIHVETGEVRRLGEYHFTLLITFISHANNVLTRQYLMSEVWKNRVVGANSLPTAIHALRVALDDNGKQQEIIKTVPKKGYVFSKQFVSEWKGETSDAEPEKPLSDLSETAIQGVTPHAVVEAEEGSLAVESITPVTEPTRRSRGWLWGIGTIALTGILAAAFLSLQRPASEPQIVPPLQLKNESWPAVDRIMIVHVANSSLAESTTPSLQNHLAPALDKINQLLETHQNTATIFYHVSPAVYSLNLLVNNQCNVTWQMMTTMENWQGHESQMGERLVKSVEKIINEMPSCEK